MVGPLRKVVTTTALDRSSRVACDHFRLTYRFKRLAGESEDVPHDRVDHCDEEASHQPASGADATQALGQPTRWADGRPTYRLDPPHNAKYAHDQQTDQGEWVESEGGLNIAVEQCVTHSGAPTQRAIPTGDGAKRARQAHASSRVQEAESQPAGKERADDSRCALGPKWSDVSRDLHVLIVPAPEGSRRPLHPGVRKRQSPTLATSQLTSRTLMTDQYRSQWPEVPSAHPQPSFVQPPAGPGYSPGPGYFVALPRSDYATWGQRVRARLIDQGPTYVGLIIFFFGNLISVIELSRSNGSTPDFETAAVAMIIGCSVILASLAWVAYNRWMIAGKTGQSLGKRTTKIRLIGEATNTPIGAKNAFIRDLVHILDALTLVGYLWPFWDDKKQTFADKIMRTIVVDDTLDSVSS